MQLALRGCQFFQSLLFGGEIRLDVSMGRFNALMSKPQGDGGDIDSGLEQVHGGRVPDHMRSNPFGEEARAIGTGTLDRLLKEMIEAVRRHYRPSDGGKSQRVVRRFQFMEPALQDPCRLRPQRNGPFLASLTMQLNVSIRSERDLPTPHVEDFRGSSPAVIHCQKQGMVTAPEPASGIGRRQYGVHLDPGEISDQTMVCAFRGDSQDAIHEAEVGGVANGDDSKERSDGGEAGIPGTDLVVPPRFEMIQEGQDGRRVQVSEGQGGRGMPGTRL